MTLIEMMIVIVVLLVILGAIYSSLLTANRSYTNQAITVEVQAWAKNALTRITNELHAAEVDSLRKEFGGGQPAYTSGTADKIFFLKVVGYDTTTGDPIYYRHPSDGTGGSYIGYWAELDSNGDADAAGIGENSAGGGDENQNGLVDEYRLCRAVWAGDPLVGATHIAGTKEVLCHYLRTTDPQPAATKGLFINLTGRLIRVQLRVEKPYNRYKTVTNTSIAELQDAVMCADETVNGAP